MVFAGATITMSERLFDSWLPNDVLYPSVFLNNPKIFSSASWRWSATRVLRDKLARQRNHRPHRSRGRPRLHQLQQQPLRLVFPSAEYKFGDGVKALNKYRVSLEQAPSSFHLRADNLTELLDQIHQLAGRRGHPIGQRPPRGTPALERGDRRRHPYEG